MAASAVRKRMADTIFAETNLAAEQADALALRLLHVMREPTEAMKSAALDQYSFDPAGHWTAAPGRVYDAMIKTAIAEE